jgi:hypothetical protein
VAKLKTSRHEGTAVPCVPRGPGRPKLYPSQMLAASRQPEPGSWPHLAQQEGVGGGHTPHLCRRHLQPLLQLAAVELEAGHRRAHCTTQT